MSANAHTVKAFDAELDEIKQDLLALGRQSLEQVRRAMAALIAEDPQAAAAIARGDEAIDAGELVLDRKIVSLLARRNPVAFDLWAVMAASKSVTDIERIGDEAARVGELTREMLQSDGPVASSSLLRETRSLGGMAIECVETALEAIDKEDADMAAGLLDRQDDLDAEFQASIRSLTTFVLEDHRNLGHNLRAVLINKSLDRIGQHACNLAEYLIYQLRGADVRHSRD